MGLTRSPDPQTFSSRDTVSTQWAPTLPTMDAGLQTPGAKRWALAGPSQEPFREDLNRELLVGHIFR